MERDADNEVINYDVWLSEDSGYYSLNEDERFFGRVMRLL